MGFKALFQSCAFVYATVSFQPLVVQADSGSGNWPSFRGTLAGGVADGFSTPTEWSPQTAKNIRWKTPIAGLGLGGPIVWADQVFVTTAVNPQAASGLRVGLYGDIVPLDEPVEHRWLLIALDKKSGQVAWEREIIKGVPKVKRHPKASHCNTTPATDGKIIVVFLGSEGLHAYDMSGKPLWNKDFGTLDSAYYVVPSAQWGFASSPVIHEGKVFIQADVLKDSFIAAFDAASGKELWRTARNDVPTWSTPTVLSLGGMNQLICNGYKHTGGYDLATGKELWKLGGGGDIPVPTPILAHDLIFITSGHGSANPIFAVRQNAVGDVTLASGQTSNDAVAWSYDRRGTYMQTPIVYGDFLYACKDNGILTCFEAKTGKKMYSERLGGGSTGFTASPVAGDGKIYFSSEEGDIYVVKAGPTFELLATNAMGEICMATPALSEGTLFIRTNKHLVAAANP